jgi:hypothetical protein
MRDPDLVYRAERAAIALERAWSDWRVMHGAGTGPLPQITSYVGYSLTEPWGEPRVVLGVPADEAERLAALLEGHDCFGPVHAEVASRPDWRRSTSSGPADNGGLAAADGRSYDGLIDVPAQGRGPEADQMTASWQDLPRESENAAWDNAARVRAARDSVTRERVARDSVTRDRSTRDRADDRRGDNGLRDGRSVLPDDIADLPEGPPPGASRPEMPWDFPSAPLMPVPENGHPEPTRPPSPAPAPVPAQGGPGYRGPRYLGSPPRYQPEADEDLTAADDAAGFDGPGWDSGGEHHVGTESGFGDGDRGGLEHARSRAGGTDDDAADLADLAQGDPSWSDLGPAVSAVGSAVEAGLTVQPGIGAAADLDATGDVVADADLAETDLAETDLAETDLAETDLADSGLADAGSADAASADDGRSARKADRPVGKDGKPARASARKAVRRTRSAAGKSDEPAPAGESTEDELSPSVHHAQDSDDSASVTEAAQYPPTDDAGAMTGAVDLGAADPAFAEHGAADPAFAEHDAADQWPADHRADDYAADVDEPGAPASGKPSRSRSAVARLARSRRTAPGAHEGSGWPSTGRTARNSKV